MLSSNNMSLSSNTEPINFDCNKSNSHMRIDEFKSGNTNTINEFEMRSLNLDQ